MNKRETHMVNLILSQDDKYKRQQQQQKQSDNTSIKPENSQKNSSNGQIVARAHTSTHESNICTLNYSNERIRYMNYKGTEKHQIFR